MNPIDPIWAILLILVSVLLTALMTVFIGRLGRVQKKQDEHGRDFHKLEKNLPREFVRREDFIPWQAKIEKQIRDYTVGVDKKFSQVMDAIGRIKGGGNECGKCGD